ncbi:MAG: hypothetical protein JST20_00210 [Bacteroidetes bacterium]|nr:hypothetical protein [Bacteroidota bacterium]
MAISPIQSGTLGSSNSDKWIVRESAVSQARKNNVSLSSNVFKKVESFMNAGSSKDILLNDLTPDEKEQFLKILAGLLKEGIIGYEILEVNGKPEKHFLVNQIGDRRLYGAKQYIKK